MLVDFTLNIQDIKTIMIRSFRLDLSSPIYRATYSKYFGFRFILIIIYSFAQMVLIGNPAYTI
jgi:hypothetical protein